MPDPLVPKKAAGVLVETSDKANAYIRGEIGVALRDTDPDYPALLLANYIIGGSTNSRLWNRIRQKEGLSYGVASWVEVSSFEPNTSFYVSATFAPEVLARLRNALKEEFARASGEGFSAQEVADGKRALLQERRPSTHARPVARRSAGRAGIPRPHVRFRGGVDKALDALTPEQLSAVLRKYVNPDAFAYIFAGDFAKPKK